MAQIDSNFHSMPHKAGQDKGWAERLREAEAWVKQWPEELGEARSIQDDLRWQVVCRDGYRGPDLIAGVDVGYDTKRGVAKAAVAVLATRDLRLVEAATAEESIRFPYIPGYLSFREIPSVVKALRHLENPPDMFLCDGQGVAHPRGLGLASHLGVILDMPSVGAAKSKLVGDHDSVGEEKGCREWLYRKGERVGQVLRSRTRVKPIYVSCGHLVGQASAGDIVLAMTTKYRLPEPTRRAHVLTRWNTDFSSEINGV